MDVIQGIILFIAVAMMITVVVIFLASFQDNGIDCNSLEGAGQTQEVNAYGRAYATFRVPGTISDITLTAKEPGFVDWTVNFETRGNVFVDVQEDDSNAPAIVWTVLIDDRGNGRDAASQIRAEIRSDDPPWTVTQWSWAGFWPRATDVTAVFVNVVDGTEVVSAPNIGWAKICDDQKQQVQTSMMWLGIIILIVAVIALLIAVRMLM